MLECGAASTGVHRRCFHGCFQKGSMFTFIWTAINTKIEIADASPIA